MCFSTTRGLQMDENLFIAFQYQDDMNEPFVLAALNHNMDHISDFFRLPNYTDFHDAMRAYLMK